MINFEIMRRLLESNIALEKARALNRQQQISLLQNANYIAQDAINNWEQMLHHITYQKVREDFPDE